MSKRVKVAALQQPSTVTFLPGDLLSQLLVWLETLDLARATRVSRRWRDIIYFDQSGFRKETGRVCEARRKQRVRTGDRAKRRSRPEREYERGGNTVLFQPAVEQTGTLVFAGIFPLCGPRSARFL